MFARADVVDENYLNGYLYWNNGKGGISWDGHSADDDVAGGNDAATPYNEFFSSPLPKTLYLNVSRLVQLDIFYKGTSGASLRVELLADQLFLAGQIGPNRIRNCGLDDNSPCADQRQKPDAPGYAVDSYRMQAELDTIPKGSIIHLRISHESKTFQYGLSGEHQSALRLPLFSPDEILYRIPKYTYVDPPGPSSQPLPNPDVLTDLLNRVPRQPSVAGLALAPLGWVGGASRRHRQALLLVLVFAASGFAGCVGGDHSPAANSLAATGPGFGGSVRSYILKDEKNETGFANSTKGSIFGQVSDTDILPVNGAYVILLGTQHSGRTDSYGRFHFSDLTPGPYHLRIDRDGFKPYEGTVNVEAASVTRIEVVLEFVVVKEIDRRPHRHDNWFDQNGKPVDSIVLIDQAFGGGEQPFRGVIVLPPPLNILPGTANVEINVTKNYGDLTFLYTKPPNDPGNYTWLYPRSSGIPFNLRTTWEMTDPGHSKFTFWSGFADGGWLGNCASYVVPTDRARCEGKSIHIKVTIHKGVVPLEPAHPDYWKSEDTLSLISNETVGFTSYCNRYGSEPAGCIVRGTSFNERAFNASWQPRHVVPIETRWLDARVRADRPMFSGSATNADAPWSFYYRDAQTPTYGDCAAFSDGGADNQNTLVSRSAKLVAKDPDGLGWTWRIPVDSGTDPPYAKLTNWCFYLAPTDYEAAWLDWYASSGARVNNPTLAPIKFTLSVIAHRDPMVMP